MTHWMFDCREISRLVSMSMDARLTLYQRTGLRLHLLMCRYCTRHRRQLFFLRELMHGYSRLCDTRSKEVRLPPETRDRLREKLRQAAAGR